MPGVRSGGPPQRGGPVKRSNKWSSVKIEAMDTVKKSSDKKRKEKAQLEKDMFLRKPPTNRQLFEARVIIPGDDQIPCGLDDPTVLDVVRQTHHAWIMMADPSVSNIFLIQAETMANLRAAVKAFYWTLHDLRLSSERPETKYLVQAPIYTSASEKPVEVVLGKRPIVKLPSGSRDDVWDGALIVNNLTKSIVPDLLISTEMLMGLGKELFMRVHIGRLNVWQKKDGVGDEFSYPEFGQLMKTYATRGGASLNTELADIDLAEEVIAWLTDPVNEIRDEYDPVDFRCQLTLAAQEYEMSADIEDMTAQKPLLSPSGVKCFEEHPRLNWTIASPDRQFDWNLQVHAWTGMNNPPQGTKNLMHRFPLTKVSSRDTTTALKFPFLGKANSPQLESEIQETRLKSSALILLKNTPYVIEVSKTRFWKGCEVASVPNTTWGIELYGNHWDESINMVSEDGRKKDWGPDLGHVWGGRDPDLQARFAGFLQSILRVQKALDGLDAGHGS